VAEIGAPTPRLHRSASRRLATGACVLALAGLAGTASLAAPAGAADNVVPGLSGYWRLKDKGAAKPVLTDWAKAEMAKPGHRGDLDVEAARWCVLQGMPYVMDNAGPLEIRQAPDETLILAEKIAEPRHIYFHLKRPDPNVFDFTPVGNSLGHREGDTLVADTMMLMDGLGPDGAPRTDGAHIIERFRVAKGGKELAVTTTWTDPKVFAKPYVYTWTYEKLPDSYLVPDNYCDPRRNGVGNYPPGEGPNAKTAAAK
jgi:hypothetical protein